MNVYKDSYLKKSEFHHLLKSTTDLYFLNIGAFDPSLGITESIVKASMTASLEKVKGYQLFLTQNTGSDSTELMDLLNQPKVTVYFDENGTAQQFSLNEATQQMFSKIFNLINTNLKKITLQNSDFVFLILNFYADFFKFVNRANELTYNDLLALIQVKQSYLVTMLFSATIIITGSILMIVMSIKIQKINEKTLSLFLLINEPDVRKMYARNETFLSFLQTGDDEDDDIYETEEENNRINEKDNIDTNKSKRRKFKRNRSTPFKLIGALIIIGSILEFFFMYVYFSSYSMSQNLQPIMEFLKMTNQGESEFFYIYNCHQTLLIQDRFLIKNTSLETKCNESTLDTYAFLSSYADVQNCFFNLKSNCL